MHGRKNIKKEGNKIMKILKCFSYNLNNDLRTYFKTCPVNNFVPLTYFELLMYEICFLQNLLFVISERHSIHIIVHTLYDLRSFQLHTFINVKIRNINIFEKHHIFPCGNDSEMRRRWRKNTPGTVTQAASLSCCGRSGSIVLEFGFQLDSTVYT